MCMASKWSGMDVNDQNPTQPSFGMEEVLQCLTETQRQEDAYYPSWSPNPHTASPYVSCIKVDGRPILPPVMTSSIRAEMAMYRRQAVAMEAEMKSRAREQLLSRVQNVLDSIQVKATPDSTLDTGVGDLDIMPQMLDVPDSESEVDSREDVEEEDDLEDMKIYNAETLPVADVPEISDKPQLSSVDTEDTDASMEFAPIKRPAGVPPIPLDVKSPERIAQAKARSPQLGSDSGGPLPFSPREDSAIDSPQTRSPRDAARGAVNSPRSEQSKVTGDSGISSRAPTATPALPCQEEIPDTTEEITDISEDEQIESLSMDGRQPPPAGIPPAGPSGGSYTKLAQALRGQLSLRKGLSSQVSVSSASTAASSEELNRTVVAAQPTDGSTAAAQPSAETEVSVLRHPLEQQHLEKEDKSPPDESEKTLVETDAVEAVEEPCAIIEISSPQSVSRSSQETQTDEDGEGGDGGLSLLSRVEFNDHDGSHSEDNLSHDRLEEGMATLDTEGLITPGPLVTPDVSEIIVATEDGSPLHDDSLSCVSSVPSKSTAIGAGLGRQVNSSEWQDHEGRSMDTCTPYTCSTELGRYMATSLDTIQSSETTLPAVSMDQATPRPQPQPAENTTESQDTGGKADHDYGPTNSQPNTCDKQSQPADGKTPTTRGSYTVEHPSFCEAKLTHVGPVESQDKVEEPKQPNCDSKSTATTNEVNENNKQQIVQCVKSDSDVSSSSEKPMLRQGSYIIERPFSEEPFASAPTPKTHVRRGSYTLEHPSPALLQSTSRSQSTNETTPNSAPRSRPASAHAHAEVANSIEDLKTKPVQRRLDYGQPTSEAPTTMAPTPVSPGAVSGKSSVKSPKASPPVHSGQGPVVALKGESEKAKQFKALASQPVQQVVTQFRDEQEVVDTPSSEQMGKQEHLHRYLQTLSRMPPPNAESSPEPHKGLYYNADVVQTSPKSQGCLDVSKLSTVRHSHSSVGARHHHASSSSGGSDIMPPSHRQAGPPPLRLRPECIDTATPSSTAEGPPVTMGHTSLTEEDLIRHQASYLEDLQQQLLRQQQEQLAQLLAEQQRQQLELQQQLMLQSQQFLLQHSRSLGSTLSSTAGTLPQLAATMPAIDPQLLAANRMQLPNPLLNNFLPPNPLMESSHLHSEPGSFLSSMPMEAPNVMESKHFKPTKHRRMRPQKSAASRSQESPPSASHAGTLDPSCVTSEDLVSLALRVQAADGLDSLPEGLEAELSRFSAMDTQELVQLVASANISEAASTSVNSGRPMSAPTPRVHFSLGSEMHYYTPEKGHSLHQQDSPVRYTEESPVIHKHRPSAGQPAHLQHLSEEAYHRFARLPALVKGHLTRQLFRSNRVQGIIKTITDTAYFALNLQQESPIKRGIYTAQDISLQERVINQLTAAMYEFHDVFFDLSTREQMALIGQTRDMKRQQLRREREMDSATSYTHDWSSYAEQPMETSHAREKQPLSKATMKAIERRRKAQEAEAAMLASIDVRPKSAPPTTSSSHRRQTSKSADRSMTGAIKRNYQHLMHRAMGHQGSQTVKHAAPSNKPNKENQNRPATRLPTKQMPSSNKSLMKPKKNQGVATRKVQPPAATNIKRITCVQDAQGGASIRRISHVQDKSKLSPSNAPWK